MAVLLHDTFTRVGTGIGEPGLYTVLSETSVSTNGSELVVAAGGEGDWTVDVLPDLAQGIYSFDLFTPSDVNNISGYYWLETGDLGGALQIGAWAVGAGDEWEFYVSELAHRMVVDPDTWYSFKLEYTVGGYVRFKIWKRAEAEPAWMAEGVPPVTGASTAKELLLQTGTNPSDKKLDNLRFEELTLPASTDDGLQSNWIETDISWAFPFNIGGVGTMEWELAFDIEAPAIEMWWYTPFNVVGSTEWAWDLAFDVGSDSQLEWQWELSFDVLGAQTNPEIGTGLVSGRYLTAVAAVGATSIELSDVSDIVAGSVIKIGTNSEERAVDSVLGSTVSFTTPLEFSWAAGTQTSVTQTTLAAPAAVGDTTIELNSADEVQVGGTVQIGTDTRVVTAISGTTATLSAPLSTSGASGGAVYVLSTPSGAGQAISPNAAFVSGLMICDKAGKLLGNIPAGQFTIVAAPSRVIGDVGSMSFRMPRLLNGATNPYLKLIVEDRLVLLADSIGSPPWLGSIGLQEWSDGAVDIDVSDVFSTLVGPDLELKEVTSDEIPASQVYAKIMTLINAQKNADNELRWGTDISTSEMFYGQLQLKSDGLRLLDTVMQRSLTEYAWRASYSGGQVFVTLVARDKFTASGFGIADGEDGNVAANPRLRIDPGPIVNAVRVQGKVLDLNSQTGECATAGAINCLDWMEEAGGSVGPTQLIPEGFASVNPGPRRRRAEHLVQLDFTMSSAEQQSAASEINAQAYSMFHAFLSAYHDQYGRPFYVNDGWQYDGPPSELERYLNTGLGWRTHLRLVEYLGKPASMVMKSESQQQALIVTYDIKTGEKKVERTWFNEVAGTTSLTRMLVHGRTHTYTVRGGVIVERRLSRFDHSSALVGPPQTFMWPGEGDRKTSYKTLRRCVSITERGAVTESWYFDMDPATGPTTGEYWDPPFNTQPVYVRPTVGDAPFKRYVPVEVKDMIKEDISGKVYDFEDRSICSWDPRRDGIGAELNRTTVRYNRPTTGLRWHFIPWGDGSGETELSTGISPAETKIYVANAFVLPQSYPYYATLGSALFSETVKVTAGSGTLLTIIRAQNGTEALPHPSGTSFKKEADCDQESPEDPDDNTQKVPWPAGQKLAEKLLTRMSKPVRRLTMQIVNVAGEWGKVQLGSTVTVNIQTEGPAGGITGSFRVLGWAMNYHAGTMELLTEENL